MRVFKKPLMMLFILSFGRASAQKDTIPHFNLEIKTGFSGIYYPTKNDLSQFNTAVPLSVSLNINDMISFNAGVVYHLNDYSYSTLSYEQYIKGIEVWNKTEFNYFTIPFSFSLTLWQNQMHKIKISNGFALGCTFHNNKIRCSQDLMLGNNRLWLVSTEYRHNFNSRYFLETSVAYNRYIADVERSVSEFYYNYSPNYIPYSLRSGNHSKELITISLLFGLKL